MRSMDPWTSPRWSPFSPPRWLVDLMTTMSSLLPSRPSRWTARSMPMPSGKLSLSIFIIAVVVITLIATYIAIIILLWKLFSGTPSWPSVWSSPPPRSTMPSLRWRLMRWDNNPLLRNSPQNIDLSFLAGYDWRRPPEGPDGVQVKCNISTQTQTRGELAHHHNYFGPGFKNCNRSSQITPSKLKHSEWVGAHVNVD